MFLHGSAFLAQPLRERMEDGETQETGTGTAQGKADLNSDIGYINITLLFQNKVNEL